MTTLYRNFLLLASLLGASMQAHAEGIDIDCDPALAATALPAHRLICDHALLSMGYRRIFADQQRLLREQRMTDAEVVAFRKQRDACTSLECLDLVFSEWKLKAGTVKGRKP